MAQKKRNREGTLCLSEVMTIIIWFHMSGYRTFKDYYTKEVSNHLRWAFPLFDKLMLRKRAIIETIGDQLKNISQIQHSRHRSPINFLVNAVSALIAYTHKEKKPSLNIRVNDFGLPAIAI